MLDPNTLTEKSRLALVGAQEQAVSHDHAQVEPIHLAVALFADDTGLARRLADKVGAKTNVIETALRRALDDLPTQHPAPPQVGFGNDLMKIIQAAQKEQKNRGDSHLAIEHLLLALTGDRKVGGILNEQGLGRSNLAKAIDEVRKGRTVQSDQAENTYDALAKYGRDLV